MCEGPVQASASDELNRLDAAPWSILRSRDGRPCPRDTKERKTVEIDCWAGTFLEPREGQGRPEWPGDVRRMWAELDVRPIAPAPPVSALLAEFRRAYDSGGATFVLLELANHP